MSELRRFKTDPDCLIAERLDSIVGLKNRGWTVSGNPTIVDSPYGKAMSFVEVTPDYLMLDGSGDNTEYDATSNYVTVAAWVYALNGVYSNAIISRDGGSNGWFVYLSTDEQFYFTSKALGSNAVSIYNTDVVNLNEWNFVSCSFFIDVATIGNNVGTMYTNGSSTNTARLESVNPAVATTDVAVGRRGTTSMTEMWGYIANPMVWKRELSAQEHLNLYLGQSF